MFGHYSHSDGAMEIIVKITKNIKIVTTTLRDTRYFPAYGLIIEIYRVYLHIQPECGKIQTRKTPNIDTFRAMQVTIIII